MATSASRQHLDDHDHARITTTDQRQAARTGAHIKPLRQGERQRSGKIRFEPWLPSAEIDPA
jgi:hypothetical protein